MEIILHFLGILGVKIGQLPPYATVFLLGMIYLEQRQFRVLIQKEVKRIDGEAKTLRDELNTHVGNYSVHRASS